MSKGLSEKASDVLGGLCDGSHKFTMSVSVRQDDTDIILGNALSVGEELALKIREAHETDNSTDRTRLLSEALSLSLALLEPGWTFRDFVGRGDLPDGAFHVNSTAVIPPNNTCSRQKQHSVEY